MTKILKLTRPKELVLDTTLFQICSEDMQNLGQAT